MAQCPKCYSHISTKQVLTGSLVCESCEARLRFPKEEYKSITRPGFYIAIFIMANSFTVYEPRMRFTINVVLLVLWFMFFKRFLKYIHEAMLEELDSE